MQSDNALLQYEAGRVAYGMTLLTDQGDHLEYQSAVDMFSNQSGYKPSVKPNGLASGGAVIPAASGTNDLVDSLALTCYLIGILTTVPTDTDLTCLRGAAADICRINSIQVTAAGAISVVSGTAAPAFSETRGAAGGPPFILVGSIEIAQVRLGAIAAAAVTAAEIFAVPNVHTEWYNYPTWNINYAKVTNGTLENAGVEFTSALPLSHTGSVSKRVYASFNEPIFADVPDSSDFVPPENSHSVSSVQIYGGTKGSSSSSLGQGGFKAYMNDGISDAFLTSKDKELWFKFFQDRLNTPYLLCRGKLGITRSFPPGGDVIATCTISAEDASLEVTT